MTHLALLFDTESALSVMAAAAGFTFFHLFHRYFRLAAGRLVQRGVAIAAVVGRCVKFVAEGHVAGALLLEGQFPYRVAFGAFFYGESLFAVVAGAARFTFFHGGHSGAFVMLVRSVQLRMAFIAFRDFNVGFMTEVGRAGLFYFVGYFFYRVAGDAFVETEGFFAVVAGTARFTFFHVRHGEGFVVAGGKDGRMASAAVG